MMYLRQSTASQSVMIGPFVDDADGNTAETGLTIANTDIRLSKNGANIVDKNSGGGTHDELGYYTITLDATDTNTVGRLQLMVHVAGALPVYHEFWVLEEAIFDALFAASATGLLPANVTQWKGSTPADLADTDKVQVSVQHMLDGVLTAAKIASNAITDAKIASGALTAAKFAAGAFDAVWSVTTRLLTAGTNIVLAKGTGVTGFNDLSAGDVRGAVGLASANLDTQLSTIDGVVDAIQAKTDNLPDDPADQSALEALINAVDDFVDTEVAAIKAKTDLIPGTIDGKTFAEGWTLIMAVLLAKCSGLGTTTAVFRNVSDTKDRVTATVDADGNRSAVTLDAS